VWFHRYLFLALIDGTKQQRGKAKAKAVSSKGHLLSANKKASRFVERKPYFVETKGGATLPG